jgi:hypothetical protein
MVVEASGAACACLQPGMETAAAFLETRRLAGMLGATVEFEKEEGITYSSKYKQVGCLWRFAKFPTTDACSHAYTCTSAVPHAPGVMCSLGRWCRQLPVCWSAGMSPACTELQTKRMAGELTRQPSSVHA